MLPKMILGLVNAGGWNGSGGSLQFLPSQSKRSPEGVFMESALREEDPVRSGPLKHLPS